MPQPPPGHKPRPAVPGRRKAPPPPGAGPPKIDAAAMIRRGAKKTGPRLYLYATEGFGKTTLAAHAPEPLLIMPPSDDGYLTLLSAGRVPDVPYAQPTTWPELEGLLDHVAKAPDVCRTLVLDGASGFEALLYDHVVRTRFKGSEKDFSAYGRGYDVMQELWRIFLQRLSELHDAEKTILVLGHADVRTAKDPLQPEHDEFLPDLGKKIWKETRKWADAVLFGTTVTHRTDEGESLGTERVLRTELGAGFQAKNRYGLPAEIYFGDKLHENWGLLWSQIEGEQHETAS